MRQIGPLIENLVCEGRAVMQGKVVVMTGATSGIGFVAAQALATMGARLVFTARDQRRGELLLVELSPPAEGRHRLVLGDLSRIAEMHRVGSEIAGAEPKVDVLVNNAGAMFDRREETEDGLERTFALNHMAYFVVTQHLLPSLTASRGARIVSTASSSHSHARLDLADLHVAKSRTAFANAYAKSKLCNVIWTRELARRLAGKDITANCFDPGFVATRFGDNMRGGAGRLFRAMKAFAASPEQGADTLVHLCASGEVEGRSGGYWVKRQLRVPSRMALDGEVAGRLWAESERLSATGLAA